MDDVIELKPFSDHPPCDKKSNGVLYLHVRSPFKWGWIDLFVENGISYVGKVEQRFVENKGGGMRDYFRSRIGHHKTFESLSKSDKMIALLEAPSDLVAKLEPMSIILRNFPKIEF